MLVELNKPTLFNILALISYVLSLLFHVIAFGTDDWCHFTLKGQRVKLGLWNGCYYNNLHDAWYCSESIFDEDIFKSGSDWHIGARVLMTCSLIVLFLMEFALIAYACIRRLKIYRERLTGIVLGMSFGVAIMTVLTLLIVGSEITMLEEGQVSVCYGLEILCLIFSVTTGILVFLDKRKTRVQENIHSEAKPKTISIIADDEISKSSKISMDISFSQDGKSMSSRSTQQFQLSSMDSDEFEKVNFYQEPIRRISVSSVESRV